MWCRNRYHVSHSEFDWINLIHNNHGAVLGRLSIYFISWKLCKCPLACILIRILRINAKQIVFDPFRSFEFTICLTLLSLIRNAARWLRCLLIRWRVLILFDICLVKLFDLVFVFLLFILKFNKIYVIFAKRTTKGNGSDGYYGNGLIR